MGRVSRQQELVAAARPHLLGVLVLASASFLVSQGLERTLLCSGVASCRPTGPDGFVISADDPRPLWLLSAVMMWPAAYMLAERAANEESQVERDRQSARRRCRSDQVVLQVTHVVGCDEFKRHIAVRRMPHVRQSARRRVTR